MSTVNDVFYRNIIEVHSIEGIEVEAHCLWKKNGNKLILVDDDQYVSSPIDNNFVKE